MLININMNIMDMIYYYIYLYKIKFKINKLLCRLTFSECCNFFSQDAVSKILISIITVPIFYKNAETTKMCSAIIYI